MIFNENGVIINEGYQLDILINEGFKDMANAGLKTVHTWIRKIIDAVQSAIEYGSRIKYNDIIKNINNMGRESFKYQLNKGIARLYPYLESEGYGKWMTNFNKALNEIKLHNRELNEKTDYVDYIRKILYEGKDKSDWFKNLSKNYNASGRDHDPGEIKKIVTNLQDFTKPLRKAYSELKILNTNIDKGMKINSEIMNMMHSYCINAISAYRNMSMILIEIFRDNFQDRLKNSEADFNKSRQEFDKEYNSINNEINNARERQYQAAKNISQRHKEMNAEISRIQKSMASNYSNDDEISKLRKSIKSDKDDFDLKMKEIDDLLNDL